MAIREYVCRKCRVKVESVEFGDPCFHLCIDCNEQMDLVEWSVPARLRVGRGGKAGGLAPEPEQ